MSDSGQSELKKKVRILEREVHQLKGLVIRDPLTGLLNRRGFEEKAMVLAKEVRQKERRRRFRIESLCLVIFDLDDFKGLNDRFGHRLGDQLLQCVADQISKRVRSIDLVGRMGGEEIALLLVGTGLNSAKRISDEIRRAINCHPKKLRGLPGFNLTVSAGVAGLREGESLDQLYRRADKALYLAKKNGKNRVEIEN